LIDEVMQANMHLRSHVITAVVSVVVGRPADFLEGSKYEEVDSASRTGEELGCDMET
jgi:hypothetical protein